VFILAKELGVGKNEARRILSQLVLRKYVRVVKGRVNLY
jgi:DNA-binding IclR family transcriptional regulator